MFAIADHAIAAVAGGRNQFTHDTVSNEFIFDGLGAFSTDILSVRARAHAIAMAA